MIIADLNDLKTRPITDQERDGLIHIAELAQDYSQMMESLITDLDYDSIGVRENFSTEETQLCKGFFNAVYSFSCYGEPITST